MRCGLSADSGQKRQQQKRPSSWCHPSCSSYFRISRSRRWHRQSSRSLRTLAISSSDLEQQKLNPLNEVKKMDNVTLIRIVAGICAVIRSEEHTSELQSQSNLVCRLL